MVDPYFMLILDQMKVLRATVDDIDDNITLYKNLNITFTRDKGKLCKVMAPRIHDGECNEYIEIEGKGSCGSTEASNQATDGQNS